jgi:transcriptional regulator with XRE-family HTH domain
MSSEKSKWIIDLIGQEQLEAAKMRAQVMMAIQAYRSENGLSQTALAKEFGVTQGIISRWENGEENLTLETIAKVAALTDRQITFMLDKSA